jgi:hypothetical protein
VVPAKGGIYGWWFEQELPAVNADDTVVWNGLRLLYVGIAPGRPPKPDRRARTLRDRLRNHVFGPVGSSTLRRSLACLLATDLSLCISRTRAGKMCLQADGESILSGWLDRYARVGWMVNERPWDLEQQLLASGPRLPLNIRGSQDPLLAHLKALRKSAKTAS